MDEALSLSARYLQPALVDRLAQASRKPAAPLTSEPMSALLRTWSELESARGHQQGESCLVGRTAGQRACRGRADGCRRRQPEVPGQRARHEEQRHRAAEPAVAAG
ncbi:hypothetical protein ACU4HD_32130 [Cupriavidus basilensis]